VNSIEALDAIEAALKIGSERSIKSHQPIFDKAITGLAVLRQEKKNGALRVIRHMRELRHKK
jgi:hypothetical protein